MDIKEYFNYKESETLPDTNSSIVSKWFINYVLSKISGKPKRAKKNYRSVFFQGTSFTSSDLSKVCSGDYNKWCKALMTKKLVIYNREYENSVDYSKLDSAIGELNKVFHNNSTDLYIKYFKDNFNSFRKEDYINCLLDKTWRTETAAKQSGGTWSCPEWEMYLHFVKLCACNGTDDDIKYVYNIITTEEPVINLNGLSVISPDKWREFKGWCRSDIDVRSDIFTISNAEGTYSYKVQNYVPPGDVITGEKTEKYAADYIYDSGFYKSSSGCCFSGKTKVLLSDGSFKEIKDLKKNDKIKTLSGDRGVLFISKPERAGRKLYSINNMLPQFTIEHPILFYEGTKELIKNDFDKSQVKSSLLGFVNKDIAIDRIPQFKAVKCDVLKAGIKICGYKEDKIYPIDVETIKEVSPLKSGKEELYDVILKEDSKDFNSYIVGDESAAFAVLCEVPFFENYLEAAFVLVNVLRILKDYFIEENYKKLSYDELRSNDVFNRLRKTIEGRDVSYKGDMIYKKVFFRKPLDFYEIVMCNGEFSKNMGVLSDVLISELSEAVQEKFNSTYGDKSLLAIGLIDLICNSLLIHL